MLSSGIAPEVQAKLKLWKERNPSWPDWYVWTGGWYELDGEANYYANWDGMSNGAVVFDIGAYEGAWTKRMAEKYPDYVFHSFEPAARAFGVARKKLTEFENVNLYNFGLGVTSGRFKLYDDQRDSATFLQVDHPGNSAEIMNIREFMESEGVTCINLAAINIEGGEFELLPYLLGSNLIRRFERLMIQWHSVVPNANVIQVAIQSALAKTNEMKWNLGAWEAWRLRSLPPVFVAARSTAYTPATS